MTMSDTKRKGEAFTIYLDKDVLAMIKQKAIQLDRSPSWLIGNLLREPLGLPPKGMQ